MNALNYTIQMTVLTVFFLSITSFNIKSHAQVETESEYFFLGHETNLMIQDGMFVDLDEDMDLDLVGYDYTSIRFFENLGGGVLALKMTIRNQGNISLDCGDLNGDQLTDIVIGGDNTNNYIFYSDAAWSFEPPIALETFGYVQTNDVEVKDIDGDGDLDIGMAGEAAINLQYFENNGFGSFTRLQLPLGFSNSITDLKYADLDSDGVLEMITNGLDGINVWQSNGANYYNQVYAISSEHHLDVEIDDINLDGNLDVVGMMSEKVGIWLNEGENLEFTLSAELTGTSLRVLEVYDINEDNYPDIYMASSDIDLIYTSNTGIFDNIPVSSSRVNAKSVVTGDVDGDDDLDMLITSHIHNGNDEIWINKFRGIYLQSDELSFQTSVESVVTSIYAEDRHSTDAVYNFQLIQGAGDISNGLFRIEGDDLILTSDISNVCINTDDQLFIRIRTTNNSGIQFESSLSLTLTDIPEEPVLTLSNNEVDAQTIVGAEIAHICGYDFSSKHGEFIYTLVDGDGAEHNSLFDIQGSKLLVAGELFNPCSNTDSILSIRINANNGAGIEFEQVVNLVLKNLDSYPIITLTSSSIHAESTIGSVVSEICSYDPRTTNQQFEYEFVAGQGDDHNSRFEIMEDKLIVLQSLYDPCSFVFEELIVRVKAYNNSGNEFEQMLVIELIDFPIPDEVVPNIEVSPSQLSVYQPIGIQVGSINAIHLNTCEDFNFNMASGVGDDHNASFSIIDDKLVLTKEVSLYGSDHLSIRIAADNGIDPNYEVSMHLTLSDLPLDTDANFTQSSQSFPSDDSRDVSLGDFNGDGYMDAYVANLNGANKVWFGDGMGQFDESDQFFPNKNTTAVEIADLDLDNDLDVFITNAGAQPNEVWLNDGSGNLTQHQSLGNSNSRSVALGDLNDDGSIDAFIGNYNGQSNRVWLNDGNGTFTLHPALFGSASTVDVEIGDINNDGRLDLVTGDYSEGVHAYLNLGAEQFGDAIRINLVPRITSIELGDFDEDGYLDVICGTAMGNNRIWSQDGGLNFYQSGFVGQGKTKDMKIGDMNGDGYLDVLVVNTNGSNQVVLNQGGAGFVSTNQNFGNRKGNGAAIADLNNDGTLDFFVANKNQANQVWLNESGNSSGRFLQSKNGLKPETFVDMKFVKGELTLYETSDRVVEKVYIYDLSGRMVPKKRLQVSNDTKSHRYHISKTNSVIIVSVVTSKGIKSFKLNNRY